jgi:hypothetical protein
MYPNPLPKYPNPLPKRHADPYRLVDRGTDFAAWTNKVERPFREDWVAREFDEQAESEQQASIFAVNAPRQEEDSVVKGTAIVLAITGALAVSGIAASAPAQAGRLASTPYGCDPSDGAYPGYAPPYAYAAYRYGYPRDCGGPSIYFYFAPAYYDYRYGGPRYFHHWRHGWHRH